MARYFSLLCIILMFYNCQKDPVITEQESAQLEKYLEEAKGVNLSLEERKKRIDTAYSLYNNLKDNLYKRSKIQQISAIYYGLKEYETSRTIDEKMLSLSIKINDSIGIAKAYGNIGIYYRDIHLDSAYKYFQKANKMYLSFDKSKSINPVEYTYDHGKVLIGIARIFQRTKDYTESEDITIKAIEKFELADNYKYLPLCYTNLGIIAKYLGRYDEAIEYQLKAIDYQKDENTKTLQILISYNNIGTVYKSKKEYEKAEEYYLKGLSYTEFLKNKPKRRARLLDNLGYVKFLADKKDKSALDLFDKAYEIRDSIQDFIGVSTNNLHYAEYYQGLGNNPLAIFYALKVIDISPKIDNNDELLRSYQILSKVSDREQGLEYVQKYIQLNDSLIKEERSYLNKFARIKFETDQKEQQIIKVQNQNTIYLLGILLLFTGIGFVVYFFRQRTRYLAQQNKIVQFQASYETETRISKRLHDELGNDIFQVMMQYQHDPHDPQIKNKLNTSYIKARDISRENNEFETGETYPEELNNMLQNYTQNGIQLILIRFDSIDWDPMDKTIKITVYRVLQELMTNMQKHSQASRVTLVFSNTNKTLLIKYSDDGIGVEEKHLKSANGLLNTEKRIRAIGGTLIFDSEKDKGFKAEIRIPN